MPKRSTSRRPHSPPRTSERPRAAAPAPSEPGLHLPHERDEGARIEPPTPGLRGKIRKAERDIAAGRIDTEARGTPSDVPRGTAAPSRRRT